METSCTAKKLLLLESFNQYFTTICPFPLDRRTIDRNNQTKEITSPCVLSVPHLREQDVYKTLYTIEASEATGSDRITAKALRIAAPHISDVVTHLFNESFNQGIYPTSRKTA